MYSSGAMPSAVRRSPDRSSGDGRPWSGDLKTLSGKIAGYDSSSQLPWQDSLANKLPGSVLLWAFLPPRLPAVPPVRFSGEQGDPLRPDPPFPFLPSNNPIRSNPNFPEIQFFHLSCWWPRTSLSRSGGTSTVSWPAPSMEAFHEVARQAPSYRFVVCFMQNLCAGCCKDATVCVWEGLPVRGSGFVDALLPLVVNSMFPCIYMVSCLHSSIPVASGMKEDALGFQSLLVLRNSGGFNSDGCCPWLKLQFLCCSFVIYTMKLDSKGIKCSSSKCFFCIQKMKADDDLAKDGGSCLLGSIHQWQIREPLLLIPRYCKRECFRLSSVMLLRNLQLIHLLPLVHAPARLPGVAGAMEGKHERGL